MSNIRVALRVRPLNDKEKDKDSEEIVKVKGNAVRIENIKVLGIPEYGDTRARIREFLFDHVYDNIHGTTALSSQAQVFEDLGTEVLRSAFDGFNACVFAYGQTGTGKTHTMMGYPGDVGLIPRICKGLFDHMTKRTDDHVTSRIDISYFEIYNEKVRDLLQPELHKVNENYSLKVREHPKDGPYVKDLSWHRVKNNEDIQGLLNKGNEYRVTAETYMHGHSSRSHAIVTVCYTQARLEENRPSEIVSKINLVDLAGSERADPSSRPGFRKRLTEGANINKSLVTLGYVIKALAERSLLNWSTEDVGSIQNFQSSGGGETLAGSSPSGPNKQRVPYIPYRDSVLTWLLKDSLGGNSKTIMIATITPASQYYSESISTLRYAQRAKNIINKPRINEDGNVALIRELRREIGRLQEMLANANTPAPHLGPNYLPGDIIYFVPSLHSGPEGSNDQGSKLMSLPESEDSIIAEKLHENEEMESDLSIKGLRNRSSSMGVMIDSQLPYLVGMDDDVLSTGIVIFHLKEGDTLVGGEDADTSQDIVLHGPSIQKDHCVIRHQNGEVYLHPCPGAMCAVQGVECTEPTKLSQGDYVVLGGNQVFRFNNPSEAAKLREHRRSQGSLNALNRSSSYLSFGGLSRASSYNSLMGDDSNYLSPHSQLGRSYPNSKRRHSDIIIYAASEMCRDLEKRYQTEQERIEETRRELEKLQEEHERAEELRQLKEEEMYQMHEQHRADIEQQKTLMARQVEENERARAMAESELQLARDSLAKEKEAFQKQLEEERKKLKELERFEQQQESMAIQTDPLSTHTQAVGSDPLSTETCAVGSEPAVSTEISSGPDGDTVMDLPVKYKGGRKMSATDQLEELATTEFTRRMSYRETEESLAIQEEDIEDAYLHTQEIIQERMSKLKQMEQEYKELDKVHLQEMAEHTQKVREIQKQEIQLEVYIQENEELINVESEKPRPLRSACSEAFLLDPSIEDQEYSQKTTSLLDIQGDIDTAEQQLSPRSRPLRRSSSAESLEGGASDIMKDQNMDDDKQEGKSKKISSVAKEVTSRLYKAPEPKFKYVPKTKEKEIKSVPKTKFTRNTEASSRLSPTKTVKEFDRSKSESPQRVTSKRTFPSSAKDVDPKRRSASAPQRDPKDPKLKTGPKTKPTNGSSNKQDKPESKIMSVRNKAQGPNKAESPSTKLGGAVSPDRLSNVGTNVIRTSTPILRHMTSSSSLASVPESLAENEESNENQTEQSGTNYTVKKRQKKGRGNFMDEDFKCHSAPDSQRMSQALDDYTYQMLAESQSSIQKSDRIHPPVEASVSIDDSLMFREEDDINDENVKDVQNKGKEEMFENEVDTNYAEQTDVDMETEEITPLNENVEDITGEKAACYHDTVLNTEISGEFNATDMNLLILDRKNIETNGDNTDGDIGSNVDSAGMNKPLDADTEAISLGKRDHSKDDEISQDVDLPIKKPKSEETDHDVTQEIKSQNEFKLANMEDEYFSEDSLDLNISVDSLENDNEETGLTQSLPAYLIKPDKPASEDMQNDSLDDENKNSLESVHSDKGKVAIIEIPDSQFPETVQASQETHLETIPPSDDMCHSLAEITENNNPDVTSTSVPHEQTSLQTADSVTVGLSNAPTQPGSCDTNAFEPVHEYHADITITSDIGNGINNADMSEIREFVSHVIHNAQEICQENNDTNAIPNQEEVGNVDGSQGSEVSMETSAEQGNELDESIIMQEPQLIQHECFADKMETDDNQNDEMEVVSEDKSESSNIMAVNLSHEMLKDELESVPIQKNTEVSEKDEDSVSVEFNSSADISKVNKDISDNNLTLPTDRSTAVENVGKESSENELEDNGAPGNGHNTSDNTDEETNLKKKQTPVVDENHNVVGTENENNNIDTFQYTAENASSGTTENETERKSLSDLERTQTNEAAVEDDHETPMQVLESDSGNTSSTLVTTRSVGVGTSRELLGDVDDGLIGDNFSQGSNDSFSLDPREQLEVLQEVLNNLPARQTSGPQLSTARRAARQRAMIRQQHRGADSDGLAHLSDEAPTSGTQTRASSRPGSGSRRRKKPISKSAEKQVKHSCRHSSDDYDSSENDSVYSNDSNEAVRLRYHPERGPSFRQFHSNGENGDLVFYEAQQSDDMLSRPKHRHHGYVHPRQDVTEVVDGPDGTRTVGIQTFDHSLRYRSTGSTRTDPSDIDCSFASEGRGMVMSPLSLWASNERSGSESHSDQNSTCSAGFVKNLHDFERNVPETQGSSAKSSVFSEKSKLEKGPTEIWSSSSSELRPIQSFRDDLSYVIETEGLSPGASSLDYSEDNQSQLSSVYVRTPQEGERLITRPDCSTPRNAERAVRISFPESQIQQAAALNDDTPVKFQVTVHEDNTNIAYNVEKTEYKTYALRRGNEPNIIPDRILVNMTENVNSHTQENYLTQHKEEITIRNPDNAQPQEDSLLLEKSYRSSTSSEREIETSNDSVKKDELKETKNANEEKSYQYSSSNAKELETTKKKKENKLKLSGVVESTNYPGISDIYPESSQSLDDGKGASLSESEYTSDYGTITSIDGRMGFTSYTSDSEDSVSFEAPPQSPRQKVPEAVEDEIAPISQQKEYLSLQTEITDECQNADVIPEQSINACSSTDIETSPVTLGTLKTSAVLSQGILKQEPLDASDANEDSMAVVHHSEDGVETDSSSVDTVKPIKGNGSQNSCSQETLGDISNLTISHENVEETSNLPDSVVPKLDLTQPTERHHKISTSSTDDTYLSIEQTESNTSTCSSDYKTPQQSPRDINEDMLSKEVDDVIIPDSIDEVSQTTPRQKADIIFPDQAPISTSSPKQPSELRTVSVNTELVSTLTRSKSPTSNRMQPFGGSKDPTCTEALRNDIEKKIAKLQRRVRSLSDSAISSDFTDGDSSSMSPRCSRICDDRTTVSDRMINKPIHAFSPTSVRQTLEFEQPSTKKALFNDSGNVYDVNVTDDDRTGPFEDKNKPVESFGPQGLFMPVVSSVGMFPERLIDSLLAIKPERLQRSHSLDSLSTVMNIKPHLSRALRECPSIENINEASSKDQTSPNGSCFDDNEIGREYRRSFSEGNIENDVMDSSNDSITFVFIKDERSKAKVEAEEMVDSYDYTEEHEQSDENVNISGRGHASPESEDRVSDVLSPSSSEDSVIEYLEDIIDAEEQVSTHTASEEIEEIIGQNQNIELSHSPRAIGPNSPPTFTDTSDSFVQNKGKYYDEDSEPLRHRFGIDEKVLPLLERSVSADSIPKHLLPLKEIMRSRSTGMLDVGVNDEPESESGIFPPALRQDDDATEQSVSLNTMSDSALDQISRKTVSDFDISLSSQTSEDVVSEISNSENNSSAIVRSIYSRSSQASSVESLEEEFTIDFKTNWNKHKKGKTPSDSLSSEGEIDIEDEQKQIKKVLDTVQKLIMPRPTMVDRGMTTDDITRGDSVSVGVQASPRLSETDNTDNSQTMIQPDQIVLPALAAPFRAQSMDSFGLGANGRGLELSEGSRNWCTLGELMIETTHLLRRINDRLPEEQRRGSLSSITETRASQEILKKWQEISIQTGASIENLTSIGSQTEENVLETKSKGTEMHVGSTQVDINFKLSPLEIGDMITSEMLPFDLSAREASVQTEEPVKTPEASVPEASAQSEESFEGLEANVQIDESFETPERYKNYEVIYIDEEASESDLSQTSIPSLQTEQRSINAKPTTAHITNQDNAHDQHGKPTAIFIPQVKSELGLDETPVTESASTKLAGKTGESPRAASVRPSSPINRLLPGFTLPDTPEIVELRKEHAKLMENLKKASDDRSNRKEKLQARKKVTASETDDIQHSTSSNNAMSEKLDSAETNANLKVAPRKPNKNDPETESSASETSICSVRSDSDDREPLPEAVEDTVRSDDDDKEIIYVDVVRSDSEDEKLPNKSKNLSKSQDDKHKNASFHSEESQGSANTDDFVQINIQMDPKSGVTVENKTYRERSPVRKPEKSQDSKDPCVHMKEQHTWAIAGDEFRAVYDRRPESTSKADESSEKLDKSDEPRKDVLTKSFRRSNSESSLDSVVEEEVVPKSHIRDQSMPNNFDRKGNTLQPIQGKEPDISSGPQSTIRDPAILEETIVPVVRKRDHTSPSSFVSKSPKSSEMPESVTEPDPREREPKLPPQIIRCETSPKYKAQIEKEQQRKAQNLLNPEKIESPKKSTDNKSKSAPQHQILPLSYDDTDSPNDETNQPEKSGYVSTIPNRKEQWKPSKVTDDATQITVECSDDSTQTDPESTIEKLILPKNESSIQASPQKTSSTDRKEPLKDSEGKPSSNTEKLPEVHSTHDVREELEILQQERLHIMDLLGLSYLPNSLTVELLEAKLNHCIGQTDLLLENLENTTEPEASKSPTQEQKQTKNYISKYRADLKKSKEDVKECREQLNKGRGRGRAAIRGRNPLRRRDICQQQRQAEIDAFKLERMREQQDYQRSGHAYSSRHAPTHKGYTPLKGNTPLRGNTPLFGNSPANTPRSDRSRSSSPSYSPGYMNPKEHKAHLVDLRRQLIKDVVEEERQHSRSCSPSLLASPQAVPRHRSPSEHSLGFSPKVSVSLSTFLGDSSSSSPSSPGSKTYTVAPGSSSLSPVRRPTSCDSPSRPPGNPYGSYENSPDRSSSGRRPSPGGLDRQMRAESIYSPQESEQILKEIEEIKKRSPSISAPMEELLRRSSYSSTSSQRSSSSRPDLPNLSPRSQSDPRLPGRQTVSPVARQLTNPLALNLDCLQDDENGPYSPYSAYAREHIIPCERSPPGGVLRGTYELYHDRSDTSSVMSYDSDTFSDPGHQPRHNVLDEDSVKRLRPIRAEDIKARINRHKR